MVGGGRAGEVSVDLYGAGTRGKPGGRRATRDPDPCRCRTRKRGHESTLGERANGRVRPAAETCPGLQLLPARPAIACAEVRASRAGQSDRIPAVEGSRAPADVRNVHRRGPGPPVVATPTPHLPARAPP